MTANEFFQKAISDNRIELLVHVRRYEDIEELLVEIDSLRSKVKKLEHDIYSWTHLGVQYQEAMDELHRCQRLLRKHGINF